MMYRIVPTRSCEWTWEMVAENGWVVARATKVFRTAEGAERSARRVIESQGSSWWSIETPTHSSLGSRF